MAILTASSIVAACGAFTGSTEEGSADASAPDALAADGRTDDASSADAADAGPGATCYDLPADLGKLATNDLVAQNPVIINVGQTGSFVHALVSAQGYVKRTSVDITMRLMSDRASYQPTGYADLLGVFYGGTGVRPLSYFVLSAQGVSVQAQAAGAAPLASMVVSQDVVRTDAFQRPPPIPAAQLTNQIEVQLGFGNSGAPASVLLTIERICVDTR
jgi:hypothetical protein